jgi:hypothetical protein
MAPRRVQIVLALEVEAPWRPTNCAAGDTQAYPRDEHCQSAVGSAFTRFDGCEFVKCTLLIDHDTGQLTFTECVFKDCNIDKLEQDEERGLYVRNNFFDLPLDERRSEFENRLAQALAARKTRGKSGRRNCKSWKWRRSY